MTSADNARRELLDTAADDDAEAIADARAEIDRAAAEKRAADKWLIEIQSRKPIGSASQRDAWRRMGTANEAPPAEVAEWRASVEKAQQRLAAAETAVAETVAKQVELLAQSQQA